ncbi:MAG: NADH-quinone oxidoreductase subunit C [Cohnella sp.]|nr:MAG: NADH-quinone oxidoreductase subunit C [Cohnella sp.]
MSEEERKRPGEPEDDVSAASAGEQRTGTLEDGVSAANIGERRSGAPEDGGSAVSAGEKRTEAPEAGAAATGAGTPRPKAAETAADGARTEPAAPARRKETEEEKAARRKAALEAREAAKAAKAAAAAQDAAAQAGSPGAAQAGPQAASPGAASAGPAGAAAETNEPPPKPPSPNQPRLDRAVQLLRELVADDAVESASINEANDHLPTLVVRKERWLQAARLFRSHEELNANYLRNVTGVDYETHMEVVYHLLSLDSGHNYAIKVRTDRDRPSVPSVTPVWETANWNEREIYDLLGIDFPGHPDLRRIMMPDDWEGHPLRKDYVPLDPEV